MPWSCQREEGILEFVADQCAEEHCFWSTTVSSQQRNPKMPPQHEENLYASWQRVSLVLIPVTQGQCVQHQQHPSLRQRGEDLPSSKDDCSSPKSHTALWQTFSPWASACNPELSVAGTSPARAEQKVEVNLGTGERSCKALWTPPMWLCFPTSHPPALLFLFHDSVSLVRLKSRNEILEADRVCSLVKSSEVRA